MGRGAQSARYLQPVVVEPEFAKGLLERQHLLIAPIALIGFKAVLQHRLGVPGLQACEALQNLHDGGTVFGFLTIEFDERISGPLAEPSDTNVRLDQLEQHFVLDAVDLFVEARQERVADALPLLARRPALQHRVAQDQRRAGEQVIGLELPLFRCGRQQACASPSQFERPVQRWPRRPWVRSSSPVFRAAQWQRSAAACTQARGSRAAGCCAYCSR